MNGQQGWDSSFLFSSRLFRIFAQILLMFGLALAALLSPQSAGAQQSKSGAIAPVGRHYGQLPISFEANLGQADPPVKFLAHGPGYTLLLTGSAAVLKLEGRGEPKMASGKRVAQTPSPTPLMKTAAKRGRRSSGKAPAETTASVVRVGLMNASPAAAVIGLDKLPGKVNYYLGKDPKNWHTDIPTYARVKYQSVYPGIDLVYYGHRGRIEYDFVAAPGADPNRIRLDIREVEQGRLPKQSAVSLPSPRIAANGDLLMETAAGELRFHKPVAYQPLSASGKGSQKGETAASGRKYLDARYVLGPGHQVGFAIAAYDHTLPLVIDPVLSYATYALLGDRAGIGGIGVDGAGDAFVMAQIGTSQFAVYALNPQGNSVLYTTYLEDSGGEVPGGIAVDSAGNAYVDGSAQAGFPTTTGAYLGNCPGSCINAPFAAKLSPDGSLAYATYLGPSYASATAIAIDSSGDAYTAGVTGSSDLPVVNAFQSSYAGASVCNGPDCPNAFLQKLNPTGSQLIYSTYFGTGGEAAVTLAVTGLAVDSTGSAYLAGNGTTVPLKNPLEQGVGKTFLAKFTPDGSGLVYSTLLGGSGNPNIYFSGNADTVKGVAADQAGNAYVTGEAISPDFPLTLKAYKASCLESPTPACDTPQVYVLKIDPTGSSLVYSTLLGAGNAGGIAVDADGNAWVTGTAGSSDFPAIQAVQSTPQEVYFESGTDAFVARLNASGVPDFSTYLGGTYTREMGTGIAVDGSGNAYVAGMMETLTNDLPIDFPVVNPPFGLPRNVLFYFPPGLFAAKIDPSSNGPAISVAPTFTPVVELRNVSSSPLTINGITAPAGMTLEGRTCGTTLAAGGRCTLILYPNVSGASGNLTISSNAAGSPQQFGIAQASPSIGQYFVSPLLLNLPAQLVGTVGPPQTVTITNLDYPNPVGITGIDIAPADPTHAISSDFSETNDCPASLTPGDSCTVSVQYQPTAGTDGPENGSLVINTDSLATTGANVRLVGIRSSESLAASAQNINFGTQQVGAPPVPRIVTLVNADTQAVTVSGVSVSGPFAQSNTCSGPLAPHASCRVAVRFVPTSNILATGKLKVDYSGQGGSLAVNLTGTGVVPSDLSVSPSQLNFHDVVIGYTEPQPVTLTNVSQSTLTISSIDLGGADYSQTNNCSGSLAPAATCTVTVSFAPATVGEHDGTLSISFSGNGSPQVVPLTGAGTTPLGVTPDSLNFGQVPVGTTSATQTISVYNNVQTTQTISSVSISGDFKLQANNCPSSLPQFYECGLQVAFAPTTASALTGAVTIVASDSTTPHTVALSGTGVIAPQVGLSPASLSFSPTVLGTTSAPQTVMLKNTGAATLTLTNLEAIGDFAETNTCGSSLAVGASCTISVTFSPTGGGETTGTVTITDNAQDSPQSVALSGEGEDFTMVAASGSDAIVSAGTPAMYSLKLTPEGGFNQTISLACSGAPSKSTCELSPASLTLDGSNYQRVSVTVATTANGWTPPGPPGGPPAPGGFGLSEWGIALLLMASIILAIKRQGRASFLAGALLLAVMALSCGGGGGASAGGGTTSSTGTPAGTYTLTVTATSGSLSHQTTLKLTVQ